MTTEELPGRSRRNKGTLLGVAAAVVLASCGGGADIAERAVANNAVEIEKSSERGEIADSVETIDSVEVASAGPSPWEDGTIVSWFDHEWTFSELVDATPEDAEGTQRIVETMLTLRNPLTDAGSGIPSDWLALRGGSGERFASTDVENLFDGTYESFLEVDPASRGEYRIKFALPGSENLSAMSLEIGAPPNRIATIGAAGITDFSTRVPVLLATTRWQGEYSFKSAAINVVDAYADLSAGHYDDESARPEPWLEDRQADEGQVFVHIDAEITEISISSVIGVGLNTHRIVADGIAIECTVDPQGSSLVSDETRTYSATCPVPVDATTLVLEIGTDGCTGGCSQWGWASEIDTGFLTDFR